jgi:hypothetical protein
MHKLKGHLEILETMPVSNVDNKGILPETVCRDNDKIISLI